MYPNNQASSSERKFVLNLHQSQHTEDGGVPCVWAGPVLTGGGEKQQGEEEEVVGGAEGVCSAAIHPGLPAGAHLNLDLRVVGERRHA